MIIGSEPRYVCFGSIRGARWTVIITFRHEAAIRIISARRSTEKETALYENYLQKIPRA